MSEPEVQVVVEEDVDDQMEEAEDEENGAEQDPTGLEDIEPTVPEHVSFLRYAKSQFLSLRLPHELTCATATCDHR